MAYAPNYDPYLLIARGLEPGHTAVAVTGRNPDIDTSASEDMCDTLGDYIFPMAARIHALVSTNVNDTAAGTGARQVTVSGLDGSYNLVSENVIMNGLVPVNTVNSYVIIHQMIITSGAGGGLNAGDISATAAVDATVTALMLTGIGKTFIGVFQVPVGFTAFATHISLTMKSSFASASCVIFFSMREFGGQKIGRRAFALSTGGDSIFSDSFILPIRIPEKAIVFMRITDSSNNNTVATGSLDLVLIQN